jgi:hypothetical protein
MSPTIPKPGDTSENPDVETFRRQTCSQPIERICASSRADLQSERCTPCSSFSSIKYIRQLKGVTSLLVLSEAFPVRRSTQLAASILPSFIDDMTCRGRWRRRAIYHDRARKNTDTQLLLAKI